MHLTMLGVLKARWPAEVNSGSMGISHGTRPHSVPPPGPVQVVIQRLRLARDWQPMLRPTRHRESFFFNPDAGRNAPTLPVEWGRGPTMAAVDPLAPFSADAPLLQVRQSRNSDRSCAPT